MIEPHVFRYVRLDRMGDGGLDRPLQFVQIMSVDMIYVWAIRELAICPRGKERTAAYRSCAIVG